MTGKFDNVSVKGIVSVVPTLIEGNDAYYEALGEKRVKKTTRITGVKKRHVDDGKHTSADYCITAAKDLMNHIGWNPDEIKVLIFVTQNPSVASPSTAFIIQKHLKLSQDCMVFDINLGCSGFVAGLHVVSSLLQPLGEHAKGLLLFCDIQRNPEYVNFNDMSEEQWADLLLFGVAGVAAAIEIDSESSSMYFKEKSDGNRYKTITRKYGQPGFMDGEAVFEFAINDVVNWIDEFRDELKEMGILEHQFYSFHQGQKFMLQNMAMVADINEDEMLFSLEEYGNTSGASVALNLCVNKDKIIKNDCTRVFMCGFGIGLSCSMLSLEINNQIYLNLIESDESYPY